MTDIIRTTLEQLKLEDRKAIDLHLTQDFKIAQAHR